MISAEGWLPRGCLTAAAVFAISHSSFAQAGGCTANDDSSALARRARWSPPLDRRITLDAPELSLRDALDHVATAAHLRLSYSADLLPLERAECVSAKRSSTGDVLMSLLHGTGSSPVVVGGDLVAIAPIPANLPASKAAVALPVNVLDRVVVTGSASSAADRERTTGLDVIEGTRLARDGANTLSRALNGYTPGVWTWPQSPATLATSYGSMRGASSFGVSSPKIYVDGIEVANPLLISRFSPDAIDRIEVVRGPEGAALYGTDAISGVINIITRHDNADATGAHLSLLSSGGVTQSQFARDAFSQDHELSLVGGSSVRSASLHVAAASVGDFIPEGHSRQMLANASARFVGSRATLSGSARFFTQEAGTPVSPLITGTTGMFDRDEAGGTTADAQQSVREYTLASNAVIASGNGWTHTFVAGLDGYRLANVEANLLPIPSGADSALRAAEGGADRGTLRASSAYQVNANAPTHATITLSAEHMMLRASTIPESGHLLVTGEGPQLVDTWQNSTGLSGELALAAANTFYVTGGLRLERDSRLQTNEQIAALPMLGGAFVEDVGPFTVKLRSAYGRGIRPPTAVVRTGTQQRSIPVTATGAETQSGIESGIDVSMNRSWALKVTRFDQRASGLIQQVAIAPDTVLQAHRMLWSLQNVGEITNRGWEIETSGELSRLQLVGAMSLVDSRVRRLAAGYTGDLTPGARMLQVPARTASLNASWNADHWFASVSALRAFDWINYDELAVAQAYLGDTRPARDLFGASLRQYWRRYDGALRLGAHLSHDLRNSMAVEITADNLLGYQLDEPDNATVVPGRTLMTGFRVKF